MKYLSFFALIILAAACRHSKTGSGNIVTEKRSTESFMAIHADGPVHVEISRGAPSVTVEADDNIMSYIETKVSGGTLDVRLRDINSLTNATINVYVTVPELKSLNSSAAANISSKDTISSPDHINLKASSSGKITLLIDAPAVMADASSGSDITVSGRTREITADASSGASVHASGLKAENATADASSGANVRVFGSVTIIATASSGGSVKYTGGAGDVKKNESSGGSVDPG